MTPDPATSEHVAIEHARALHQSGRDAEALAVLAPVLGRGDASVPVYTLAADIQLALGAVDESERMARAALALGPENIGALATLSLVYVARRDPRRARELATRILNLYPDNWSANSHYAQIDLGIKLVSAHTVHIAERGVLLAPDNLHANVTLGDVWLRYGNRARAADAYRAALRLDPTNAHARHNLAVATKGVSGMTSMRTFGEVLGENPDWSIAGRNFTAMLFTPLTVLMLILIPVILIVGGLVFADVDPRDFMHPALVKVLMALTLAAALIPPGAWLFRLHRLTHRAPALVRAAVNLQPGLAIWIGALAFVYFGLLVAVVLPEVWSLLGILLAGLAWATAVIIRLTLMLVLWIAPAKP